MGGSVSDLASRRLCDQIHLVIFHAKEAVARVGPRSHADQIAHGLRSVTIVQEGDEGPERDLGALLRVVNADIFISNPLVFGFQLRKEERPSGAVL